MTPRPRLREDIEDLAALRAENAQAQRLLDDFAKAWKVDRTVLPGLGRRYRILVGSTNLWSDSLDDLFDQYKRERGCK